jgi:hypothetical protein
MYGQSPTVSKNGNLEEVAEIAYLILSDPSEYRTESPQLLANLREHPTPRTPAHLYLLH